MRLFVGKGLLDLRETRASSSRSDPLLNQVNSRPAAVCSIERTLFMDGHLAPQLIGTAFIRILISRWHQFRFAKASPALSSSPRTRDGTQTQSHMFEERTCKNYQLH